MLKVHNELRTNPSSFIKDLENFNSTFSGRQATVTIGKVNMTIETNEGTKPVTELIEFLKELKPLEPLTMNMALRNESCKHVLDQGPTGEEGHKSSGGLSFLERVHEADLNTTGYVLAENIAYGVNDAKVALLSLAIDDGVLGRGHRKNIFAKHATQIGICNGKHKLLSHMAVLIYRGKTSTEKAQRDGTTGSASKDEIL